MMDNFVVVTATKYGPRDSRFALAKNMIRAAARRRYTVLVVDDSFCERGDEFSEYVGDQFSALGAIVIPQKEKGFGNAVREAVEAGAKHVGGDGMVAWQEPEKVDMIEWYAHLLAPLISNRADLVIPRRSEKSLETYPYEQVLSEKLLNRCSYLLSNKKFDFDFGCGVRVFRANHARFFLECDGKKWDALITPVIRMARAGVRIESVEVDYMHPLAQTQEEEGCMEWVYKRLEQLQYTIPVFASEWSR